MDNLFRSLKIKIFVLFLLFINSQLLFSQPLTPGAVVDSPLTAIYSKLPTFSQVVVGFKKYGDLSRFFLDSSPPNQKGGSYISPVTTDPATPKIASNVKIPLSTAAGLTVGAVLTAPVLKSSMAKAAVMLVRANPYVSTALTIGWLVNAGYHFFSDTGQFKSEVSSTTATQPGCSVMPLGTSFYNPSNHHYYYAGSPSGLGVQPNLCNGSDFRYSICDASSPSYVFWPLCDQSNVLTAPLGSVVTDSQVEMGLTNTPISGSVDTPETINQELGELIKNDYIPELDTANPPKLRGPNGETTITTQGDQTTTVYPDGATRLQRLEYQTRFADDRAELEQTVFNTDTTATGQTSNTSTTSPSGLDNATVRSQNNQPSKTDCDKYPDSIGCSKYGEFPIPEIIPVIQQPASLNYSSWGDGSCPAPVSTVHGIVFDYQPMCDKLVIIKPILLSFGLILSLFIIVGAVKD